MQPPGLARALQTAASVSVSARFLKSQEDKFISLSLSLSKMRDSGKKEGLVIFVPFFVTLTRGK
jgi:hypothetical protein